VLHRVRLAAEDFVGKCPLRALAVPTASGINPTFGVTPILVYLAVALSQLRSSWRRARR
jgi:hypothetical protein